MGLRGTVFARPDSFMANELDKFERILESRFGYVVAHPVHQHLEDPAQWRSITTLLEGRLDAPDPLFKRWKMIFDAFQRTAASQVKRHNQRLESKQQ